MDRLSFRITKSKEAYQHGKHTESAEIINDSRKGGC